MTPLKGILEGRVGVCLLKTRFQKVYSDADVEVVCFGKFQDNVETIRATCGDQEPTGSQRTGRLHDA